MKTKHVYSTAAIIANLKECEALAVTIKSHIRLAKIVKIEERLGDIHTSNVRSVSMLIQHCRKLRKELRRRRK